MLAVLAASHGAIASAEDLPLWELGIGAVPSTYPAYRGSRDQKFFLLPLPYIVYRGDILKIDRKGMRAQLFESDRLELNISVNGAVPARSNSGSAREGMPNLHGVLEIGPALDIVVAKPAPKETLKIRLPVRSVISTNLRSVGFEGWVFNPQLELDYEGGRTGWSGSLSVGPEFATRKYHAYYYEVAPEFATATRPAYHASAGYSGAMAIATFSRHFAHFWVGGFMRYDYLGGAAFEDSPLVETNHSLMGGIAAAWIFATSEKTVTR
jgi:MipA family protein